MQSMSLAFCSGTCWYVVDDDDEEVEEDTDSNLANVFNARNNRILVVGGFVSVEVNVVLRERNGSGVQGRMAMYNVGVVGFDQKTFYNHLTHLFLALNQWDPIFLLLFLVMSVRLAENPHPYLVSNLLFSISLF